MEVLYEDNHIIIVDKQPGDIVQGDKTGDVPLSDHVRAYLKEKYAKPGNVFVGVVHRLDRPVGGAVVFAKTSKALSRLNEMLRKGEIHKTYWALTQGAPSPSEGTLVNDLRTVEKNNKTYIASAPGPDTKEARLSYKTLCHGDSFSLVEIELLTGRKHQIRVQLSGIGCPIRGDLKYGAKRSLPGGGISLLARKIEFVHPVSGKFISVEAPVPDEKIWHELERMAANHNN